MKKVLMIAQSFYDLDPRILKQTKVLINNDINVDIICLGEGSYKKEEMLDDVHVYRIMRKFNQEKILSYILNSAIFLIKALLKSIILGAKNNYNLVQIHNMPDYLVFAALKFKFSGVPVVLDIHDLTVELFKEKWGIKKFRYMKHILTFTEKICVKFADKIITVSEQCGERLLSRGLPPDKLTIVMNVPDSSMFSYNKNRNFVEISTKLRLIYTGTVAERYGIHLAIKAIYNVAKVIPDTIFEIYGNSETTYYHYLKKLISKLNLFHNVKFNGVIPYEQISEKIKDADIALVMSVNSEYTNLGIPTKIFEYANSGLPIIVTDIETVRMVFGEEAMRYVNTENTDQISQTIIELCKNPELRKNMSINAYNRAQEFSGDIMIRRYLDLIKMSLTN